MAYTMSMRLIACSLIVLFGLGFLINYLSVNNAISTADASNQPVSICSFGEVNAPVSVSAKAWQITDLDTGAVLAENHPDVVLPLASVVKLLTAHLVLGQTDNLSTAVTLVSDDVLTEGRAGGLKVGEEYTAYELLFPLLVTSSNDAGAALARTYPNLISQMQNFVQSAGAFDTTVVDTTGLSQSNTTTVHDLSLILRKLYLQSPHIFDITRISQVIGRYENGWVNNIPFRELVGYQGGKQGYLPEVGQTGAAVFSIGEDNPKVFIISILSSESVAQDMKLLHQATKESFNCELNFEEF